MALSNADKQQEYRKRKVLGLVANNRQHSPLTSAQRQQQWRKRHPEQGEWQIQRHLKLKEEVLTHYGNGSLACVVCGEGRLACLSIDHISGGGNKQRKGVLGSTSGFYAWLKRNDYPEGYQTLCMNCQFVKRFERGKHN